MKKVLFAVAAIATISFAFTTFSEVLPIGASIPKADLKLKDISGKEVALKDAKKKNGLLVMFTCNTCPWVIKNQSRTKEIANYALSNDIGVILLNSNEGQRDDADSFSEMKAYAARQGYKWYYAVDTDNILADEFGANRTPEVFLFNGEGKHVYHGAIDDNPGNASSVERKHLKVAIDEIVAGKDVSVKESRSMGCQIKRKG
ncbi:MAG TPA: thioredoxin family protein [Chitinophagaceae bacterium]|nr:thioredoxin family protein [Chitinophagaceae bacterium]